MRFGTHHLVITVAMLPLSCDIISPNKTNGALHSLPDNLLSCDAPKAQRSCWCRAVPTPHPTTNNEHILIFSVKKKKKDQQFHLLKAVAFSLTSPPSHPSSVVLKWKSRDVVVPSCSRSDQTVVIYRLFVFFSLMEELAGHFDAVHRLHLYCTSLLCCLFIIYGHCQSGLEGSNLQFRVMGRVRTAVRFN